MNKKDPIGSQSNFEFTNVYSPSDFSLSYINVNLRLSKDDLGGGDEYIRKLFDELATEVINKNNRERE